MRHSRVQPEIIMVCKPLVSETKILTWFPTWTVKLDLVSDPLPDMNSFLLGFVFALMLKFLCLTHKINWRIQQSFKSCCFIVTITYNFNSFKEKKQSSCRLSFQPVIILVLTHFQFQPEIFLVLTHYELRNWFPKPDLARVDTGDRLLGIVYWKVVANFCFLGVICAFLH